MRAHLGALLFFVSSLTTSAAEEILLLTTSTVDNSGLLKHLLADPVIHQDVDIAVKAAISSSGRVFASVRKGNGDLILTHDPLGEQSLIDDGFVRSGYYFMHNDYLLTGPQNDPAGASYAGDVLQALQQIHLQQQKFLARADLSGTSRKELQLWELIGVDPNTNPNYLSNGQGMGTTLLMAYETSSYTLSDSATWHNFPRGRRPELTIRQSQNPILRNQYSLYVTAQAKPQSIELQQWLCEEGQRRLLDFRDGSGALHFNPDGCARKWPK